MASCTWLRHSLTTYPILCHLRSMWHWNAIACESYGLSGSGLTRTSTPPPPCKIWLTLLKRACALVSCTGPTLECHCVCQWWGRVCLSFTVRMFNVGGDCAVHGYHLPLQIRFLLLLSTPISILLTLNEVESSCHRSSLFFQIHFSVYNIRNSHIRLVVAG